MTEKTASLTTEKQGALQTASEKSLATRDETRYVAPPVDIFETEDAIVVIADLPGVGKEDVIFADDGILR
jgi:HSP20 family molecular chaperone IbpA